MPSDPATGIPRTLENRPPPKRPERGGADTIGTIMTQPSDPGPAASAAEPSTPQGDDFALILRNVCKSFGAVRAVDDLSFAIPRGSIVGFLGQNGAGKTTTLRMIMSILYPDQGSIEILGEPDAEAIKDRLGYLPEEKGLYRKMKVGEILAYFGRLKGLPTREAKKRSRELLERYGLGDWIDKKCEALSKGMGQKVQVLGTLIHEPELVILDEPFSGLDPVNTEVMRELILDLRRGSETRLKSNTTPPRRKLRGGVPGRRKDTVVVGVRERRWCRPRRCRSRRYPSPGRR